MQSVPCTSHTKVTNLRVKGSMQGEGGFMNLKNLYYLSCHFLDSPDVVKYGKARLGRELIDLWVDRKIEYGGLQFIGEDGSLTQSVTFLRHDDYFCFFPLKFWKNRAGIALPWG